MEPQRSSPRLKTLHKGRNMMLPVPSQPHPSDDDLSDPAQPFASVTDLDDDFEPSPIATIPSPNRRANRKRRRGEGSSTISQAVDTTEVKKN